MDEFNYLEEPPRPDRRVVNKAENRKSDLLIGLPSRSSSPSGGDSGATARPHSRTGLLLSLVALVMLSVQGWRLHRVRSDLVDLRTVLEQTHGSLGLVWESSKGHDQELMGRLALLADSIRLVSDYAQGEVQLWQQRLAENERLANTRLDDIARADQVRLARLDAVERQNRTYSSAFEALARRATTQESSARDVSAMVAWLRETLGKVDAAVVALEQRHATSATANAQLGRRVESLSGWADGFRQAGLSGEAVQGRFSSFADELRRLRIRVDSLRPMARAVTTSDTR